MQRPTRATLQYVQSVEPLISLNEPSLPSMHWHDNAGWEVCIALAGGRVRCMYMYIET